MAMQPLPFSLGVVVIIVVAMVQLALVDPVLLLVALGPVPRPRAAQQRLHQARRGPPPRAQARVGAVSAVAHESFDGALVVKTLGLEDGRRAPADARPTRCVTSGWSSGACAPASSQASTPSQPRHHRPAWLGTWRVSRRRHHRRARAGHGAVRHPRLPDAGRRLPAGGAARGRRRPRPDRGRPRRARPRAPRAPAAPRRAARRRARAASLRATGRGARARRARRSADAPARSSPSSARPVPGKTTSAACSPT